MKWKETQLSSDNGTEPFVLTSYYSSIHPFVLGTFNSSFLNKSSCQGLILVPISILFQNVTLGLLVVCVVCQLWMGRPSPSLLMIRASHLCSLIPGISSSLKGWVGGGGGPGAYSEGVAASFSVLGQRHRWGLSPSSLPSWTPFSFQLQNSPVYLSHLQCTVVQETY